MTGRPCRSKACAGARGNSTNHGPRHRPLRPKKETAPEGAVSFAEPVSLPSTSPADFRLPPTAFARGFDLLTSRTRRRGDSKTCPGRTQGARERSPRILRSFLFSTFPQRFVQPVEDSLDLSTAGVNASAGPIAIPLQTRRMSGFHHWGELTRRSRGPRSTESTSRDRSRRLDRTQAVFQTPDPTP